jgi:cold shock CspA family protein
VRFNELQVGDRVEFEREPDPRGRGDNAVHVRRVDG